MILDGIIPPLLVLFTAAGLLVGRRVVWGEGDSARTAPPAWMDAAIVVLMVALSGTLLLAMGRSPVYWSFTWAPAPGSRP